MTEDELAKYKGRLAKPDVETENATDAKAVSQLSSDVRCHLERIKYPTLIRDFAKQMMEHSPHYVEQAEAQVSEKLRETFTDDDIRERCLSNLIKRLTRGIGDDKNPGELYPFAEKEGKKLPAKNRRFSPLPGPDTPAS
jgi:hypothetical protein